MTIYIYFQQCFMLFIGKIKCRILPLYIIGNVYTP